MELSHVLLNRVEASKYIGIDPVSFDRYFRQAGLPCFMIGKQERYLTSVIDEFIRQKLVS